MKFPLIFLFSFIFLASACFASEGTMLFTDANASQNISSLALSVLPGSSNITTFRIYAQGDNITNIALFTFSQKFNISITPGNESFVAGGDFRSFSVTISVSNLTQAGTHTESLIILSSKPEQRLLPILIDIPETTGWNVSINNISMNVTYKAMGVINVSLLNSGNIPISGHVSLLDLHHILWFDQSDFLIPQGATLSRPLYYFMGNLTPGRYEANLSFIDTLNNIRGIRLNFTIPDTTPPSGNLTFNRDDIYPGQKVTAYLDTQDDVAVDSVRGRINTDEIFFFNKTDTNKYKADLINLTIGENSLLILMNDTAGNTYSFTKTLNVTPYDYLTVEPVLNFYRFKLSSSRQVKILSSITTTQINFSLKSLSLSNDFNNSINISVNGNQINTTASPLISVSGDVYLEIIGNHNFTKFSGVLGIQTSPEVRNPQPEILFNGEISDYDVTPPMNFLAFGIIKSCNPEDVGVYENSSYVCQERHPNVDIKPEELSISISKASYDSLVKGYDTKYSACEDQKNGAIGWNWFLVIMILIFIGGVVVDRLIIQKTDFA